MILAIDPGSIKCGAAVLDQLSRVVEKRIIEKEKLEFEIFELCSRYPIKTIVVGCGTGSKDIKKMLSQVNLPADKIFIPEKNSTHDAKTRYFRDNPPPWYLRVIPCGLLFPLKPIDDYAAVVLGERYLKN